jgi:hypothetical protein
MKKLIYLFLYLTLAGCTSKEILNLNQEPVPSNANGSSQSLEDVQFAILSACKARGWTPKNARAGEIEASIIVRSHRAKIEIIYSRDYYSITYIDSSGLDYDDGDIHKNYNNWIAKLNNTIQRELGVRAQRF